MVWVARVGSGLSVAPLPAPSWGGFRGLLPWCVGVCSMVGEAVSRWVEPFPGGWSHFLVGGAVSRWVEPFLSSAPPVHAPPLPSRLRRRGRRLAPCNGISTALFMAIPFEEAAAGQAGLRMESGENCI